MEKKKECEFSKRVNEYLATHEVKGMSDFSEYEKYAVSAGVAGEVDATVTPCHKKRILRFWGALAHLRLLRSWGLEVDEFDPDAAARGCCPDVIFCELEPYYTLGDIEQLLGAVRRGTHFIVLHKTDLWANAIAKRLGYSSKGILAVNKEDDAIIIQNDSKLFAGFPEGRLDAARFNCFKNKLFGVNMTGERALMAIADKSQKKIATAIAQYRYGKGAITLVAPFADDNGKKTTQYKRMILNLITYIAPICSK
jgi:hypothetical protein